MTEKQPDKEAVEQPPAPAPAQKKRYTPAPDEPGDKHIYYYLARAQAKFKAAKKDTTNPFFKSKYADLDSVVDAIKEAMNSEGLFFYQSTRVNKSGAMVETVFGHESGQELSAGEMFVPAQGSTPQDFGSALTYARRYSLMAACGLAPEDDDGNGASGRGTPPAQQQRKPAPPYKPDPANMPPSTETTVGKMPDKDVAYHLDQIRQAEDEETVNARFIVARKEAGKFGDKTAVNQFTAAGAARKALLVNPQQGEGQ